MPVPEQRLYSTDKLNRWFAVSSVLMAASIFWFVEVDYDRPWRGFQDRYYVGKAALAHLDWLDSKRQERQQEIRDAEQRLRDATELVARVSGTQREVMLAGLADADLAFRKADGEWSRKNQLLDVTRNRYEEKLAEYGQDHPVTEDARRKLVGDEDEVDRLRVEKESWEDKRAELKAQLKTLDQPVREARKRLRNLETVAEEALAQDQSYRGVLSDEGLLGGLPLVKSLINFPLLDFTAPKNTPARHQVNQLVLPGVRQRLNYLESYTTDRCTTCHVAINDPEFSKDRLVRKLERSLPGINEALQRMGLEPYDMPAAPSLPDAERSLPVGQVSQHWNELTEQQRDAYFDKVLGLVNDYLELTNRKTIDLSQPILAHPDLDLYVSVDSPHPMAKVGCTVCHEGNPQETDFVQAAHTPSTHKVRERWEEEYYIRLLGVPNITFETVEHYWDRPMRLPQYTEAGCAKCHTEISDIARVDGQRKGARINLGRHLFTNVGCVNCHAVDTLPNQRRVGPNLKHIADKLRPEFVQRWAFAPQSFRPSTRMPHFFMQENNRAESANSLDPEPVLRTETEVAAISKYLFSVSSPWQPIAKPAGITGDADRGRELFNVTGCLACHANMTEFGKEWITADIAQEENIDAETARHRYLGMTHNQRVRYAMEHFANERDTFLDPDTARFDPDAEYNTPVLTRFAPELSGIGSKVTFDWLYSWLADPTHYAPNTKMPNLRLIPAETADIAAYLLTLKRDDFVQQEFELTSARLEMADNLMLNLLSAQRSEKSSRAIMADKGGELTAMLVALIAPSLGKDAAHDLINPMDLTEKKLVYLGNKMIGHYGCYACHEIAGFENTTPPGTNLTTWAEKPITQLDFAFYDDAFHHMREQKEETYRFVYPRDAQELNAFSPIADDAREEITHTHAAFAKHKMLNPRIWDREKIKGPYDKLKMPNFYFTEKEAEALATFLLSRIPPRVTKDLTIKYAGNTSGPIARGRNLTRELNCIACHQIEDNAPTIQQYFRRVLGGKLSFDSVNAPPSLWGEGAKVQHNWLHGFFQNVEPLRPWLRVRMPSFNLTGDESATLVEYFAALSQDDSMKLAKLRGKVSEYTESKQRAATAGDTPIKSDATPGSDWYEQESLERTTTQLRRWCVERKLMRPAALDPLRTSGDRLRAAHKRLLDRVDFIQELYDVEYPFVEPPPSLSSREYFERGKRFFNDMGCLHCHVLGNMLLGPARNTDDFTQMYRLDGVRGEGEQAIAILNGEPYPIGSVIDNHTLISATNTYNDTGDVDTQAILEGPNAAGEPERILLQAPSAPNLALTYQRLRRTWVRAWMVQPQWIQPGTRMPQNFPAGASPFEGDPAYPGTSAEHIDLLVDFLYHARFTSTRAPLTKIVVTEDEGGLEEDEDFDEDDFDD